jgi:hypothetical protein
MRSAADLLERMAVPEQVGPTASELRQIFDDQSGYIDDDQVMWYSDFAAAARAVLARWERLTAPEPVEPSYEDLDEFAMFWWGADADERTVTDVIEGGSMSAFARVVLARWGNQS